MSLTNIRNLQKEKGFTIVELLIVVIVIAILAAIVIVAYNGITDRANNAAAQETSSQFRNKATAWQAVEGTYPTNAQVDAGLVSANVTEAALGSDLQSKVNTGTGTPTPDEPLVYNCPAAGGSATLTYYQTGGDVTDTLGACPATP